MKRLLKLALAGAWLCPVIGFFASCSEEADCSMVVRPMMNGRIYTLDADGYVQNDTLDSLTVTAWGTDSILINREAEVRELTLPLRYTADSTVLVFRYAQDVKDTVLIRHTNTPYFLSMDCGYQMRQILVSVSYTRHLLDSIHITQNEAGSYGQENIRLFY